MVFFKPLDKTSARLDDICHATVRTCEFVNTTWKIFAVPVVKSFYGSEIMFYRIAGFKGYFHIGVFKQLGDECGFSPYICENSPFLHKFIIVRVLSGNLVFWLFNLRNGE
jgi:hypothetical protein